MAQPRKSNKPVVTEAPAGTPADAVTAPAPATETPVATIPVPVTGVAVDSWMVDFTRVPSVLIGTDPANLTCILSSDPALPAKSTNEQKRAHILWVLLALTSAPTSARGLEYRKWVSANEASLLANYGKYYCKINYHDSSVLVATQFKLGDIVPTIAKQWNDAFGPSVKEFGTRAAKARAKAGKEEKPVEFEL